MHPVDEVMQYVECPEKDRPFVNTLMMTLYACYTTNNYYAANTIVSYLKKKGVRITDNFLDPLTPARPVCDTAISSGQFRSESFVTTP